jgi:hypothetical protein
LIFRAYAKNLRFCRTMRKDLALCNPERKRRISGFVILNVVKGLMLCHPERSEGSQEILRAEALRMRLNQICSKFQVMCGYFLKKAILLLKFSSFV